MDLLSGGDDVRAPATGTEDDLKTGALRYGEGAVLVVISV